MVLVTLEGLDLVYRHLQQTCRSSSSLVILVAADVDALAACRIFCTLLKSDCIPHKIVPVSTYADLTEANETYVENNDELKVLVMINCCGVIDISEFFVLPDHVKTFIVDAHRPLNLKNLFGNPQITIIDDGEFQNFSEIQKAYDTVTYADSDSEDSEEEVEFMEEEEDDSEKENEERDLEGQSEKKKRSRAEILEEKELDPLAEDLFHKRVKLASKRKGKRQSQKIIAEYYAEGNSYGTSAACLMYEFGSRLGRTCNENLWWAILGLTEQYLSEKSSYSTYCLRVESFKEEVSRLNISDTSSDYLALRETDTTTDRAQHADDFRITHQEELRLMLLRHWSLNESFRHSTFTATRLGLWREKGRRRLSNLIANLSIPSHQCEEVFPEMTVENKKKMHERLKKIARQYKLNDISFPSFVRHFGYRITLSAADTVFAITALMDFGFEWLQKHLSATAPTDAGQSGRKMAGIGVGLQTGPISHTLRHSNITMDFLEQLSSSTDESSNGLFKNWTRNFYIAWDALSSVDLIVHGVQLSLQFQKSLVQTGNSLLDRQLVKNLHSFRFVVLANSTYSNQNETSMFTKSLAHLHRLGQYIIEAYKSHHERVVPLVLAALNEEQDSYLVVGMIGTSRAGDVRKNAFGLAFQTTAEATGARIKLDTFDANVMEIKREDLVTFMENLKHSL